MQRSGGAGAEAENLNRKTNEFPPNVSIQGRITPSMASTRCQCIHVRLHALLVVVGPAGAGFCFVARELPRRCLCLDRRRGTAGRNFEPKCCPWGIRNGGVIGIVHAG